MAAGLALLGTLATRNDGQASARAVGRQLRIFSRGAHAASRLWLPGFVPDAVVDDAGHGCPSRAGSRCLMRRSLGLVPAPLETFLPFLRLLHGRAVQTARPRRLSSRRLPLQGDHLSPCMRLSDFIHAAMNCPREKQATGRRTSHPRQATDVGARCPCPRVSLLAGGHM
jgi:hypothetical protein